MANDMINVYNDTTEKDDWMKALPPSADELRILEMATTETTKGGPGSGNFGHSGIPGHHGGSQAGKGGKSPVDSPAFKTWFGDSKVVDAAGQPLVVYHGTRQNFDAFDTKRDKASNKMGAYFSEDAEAVNRFLQTSPYSRGDQVLPVYLSIRKPLDLRKVAREDIARAAGMSTAIQREMRTQGAAGPYATLEWLDKQYDLVPKLKRRGYDGIVFDGQHEGITWVAFKPNQIKSAFNSGGFDPNSPNILKEALVTSLKGGPGSGNHGHAGRPGKRGGSMPQGGVPAAFHGDKDRYDLAMQELGGDTPKKWYSYHSSMQYQLELQPGSPNYQTSFQIEALKEKYFVVPKDENGDIDWHKYAEAQDAQRAKFTIDRAEYQAIYDELHSRVMARQVALRKTLGLPDDVHDLLGPDFFNQDLDPYDRSKTPADADKKSAMYNQLDDLGRKIVAKAGIDEYGPDELAYGLTNFYSAQVPKLADGHTAAAGIWLDQMDTAIRNAGEFETMHKLSSGDWSPEKVREEGFSMEGRIDDWKPLPDTTYHVTTNSAALAKMGIKSRFELGMHMGPGLGGGSDKTISLSTDRNIAKSIERSMHEAQMVASNQVSVRDLLNWAKDGAGGVGHNWAWQATHERDDSRPPADFDPLARPELLPNRLKNLIDFEAGQTIIDPWDNNKPWTQEKYNSEKWSFYSIDYMYARQWQGGFENPVFFSTDTRRLAASDPRQFKTHVYRPASKKTLGWQMSGLKEWRVVGSDTIKQKGVIDFYDPDDPNYMHKIIYGD